MTHTLLRRLSAAVAVAAVGALAATTVTAPTASATPADDYLAAQRGDFIDVRIGDLLPTQPSLGYDEVLYKLGRYNLGKDATNKKFADWCEASGLLDVATVEPGARLDQPASFSCALTPGNETKESADLAKSVVIGPGGKLYLTDGHHTLTAFAETPDGGLRLHVRLRVLGNLSGLSEPAFWNRMIQNRWTWLRDPSGASVTPSQLPTSVGLANFADDKYRSLLYFARDIGYAQGTLPFQEFYWGAWLRDSKPIDLSGWNQTDFDSYLATVKALTERQVALADDEVLDSGFTAAQLGKFAQWNNGKAADKGEFDKLSKPYSDSKPGKLGYMLEYKNGPRAPFAPSVPRAEISGSKLSISWGVPAASAAAVTTYRVLLSRQGGSSTVREVSGARTSVVFAGLRAGRYTATVVAWNAVGNSQRSAVSNQVVVRPVITPAKPTITGNPKVNGVLKAKPGAWRPAGVKLSYQWLRNGKSIKHATTSSYRITWADKGKRIAVKVTGKLKGAVSISKTSESKKVR